MQKLRGLWIIGWLLLVAGGLLVTEGECQAQAIDNLKREKGFVLERFRPSFDPNGVYNSYGGQSMKQWEFFLGFWANFGYQPLSIVGKGAPQVLVEYQLAGDIGGGVSLLDRKWAGIEVSLSLPILFYQNGSYPTNTINCGLPNEPDCVNAALPNAGPGDLGLALKYRLLDQRWQPLNLALVVGLTFPTGNKEALHGAEGIGAEFTLALSRRMFKIWNLVGNVGFRIRPARDFLGVAVRNELTYRLGTTVEVWKKYMEVALEVAGGVGIADIDIETLPLEVLAGLRFYPLGHKSLQVDFGGSAGVLAGYGIPTFRIFLGISYAHRNRGPLDTDGDGIIDAEDSCVNTPGPASNKGCPLDTDKDGIIDSQDKCPNKPGPRVNQGCPYGDSDKDGVLDHEDTCPNKPGAPDNNGCPWGDTDGDGLKDNVDQCPKEPGPKESQGCPDKDRDKDTVVDRKDNCPDIPGPPSNQGCPKKVLVKVDRKTGRILLLEKVYFKTASAVILRRSYPILKQVVAVMSSNPKIKIQVQGHTDSRGSARYNLKLSQRRTRSVRRYLINKGGIDGSRLTAKGYGESKPIATNRTRKGRAKNRRVEFHIK